MSDLMKGRDLLEALAKTLPGPQRARLRAIMHAYLFRETPVRRAPNRPVEITDAMKRDVRAYAYLNPNAHQVDIGAEFGINPGRVSEILNGKR